VTILQWFKRFDATLGFRLFGAPKDYSTQLHPLGGIAQETGEGRPAD